MNSIFILSLVLIFIGFILLKNIKINKNIIFCIFITILIIIFSLNIENSLEACIEGIKLCFKSIIPTIFTFSVICNLLILYDGIEIYSRILGPIICRPLGLSKACAFPIAASMLCGYPLGAKYSTDLYSLGHINFKEYNRLLKIASNAGPIFIIGAIGASLLNNISYGYFLLISNYFSLFLIGLFTRPKNFKYTYTKQEKVIYRKVNFGRAMDTAINNSIKTTVTVSGYVVAFSVFISFFKNSDFIINIFNKIESFLNLKENILYSFFLGSIEMTNGCNIASNSNFDIHLKLGLISFFLAFSGLSIIAQTSSFTSKYNIKTFKFLCSKLIQGIISFIISFSLSKFVFISEEVFSGKLEKATSIYNLIPVALIILLIPFFIVKFKNLFHSS
ncbi:sporulation integral membrane protein YlbJ [Clostridium sp. LY3-2]|uniref:sporulation integral membrane protein YlbJ n=1 Tax=Clostridium sp. LY3-2 TaxID=2942482 RepID=UPI00215276EB|nr:sporulation integral membrane protein YlbJ [Clostridium sp. LY3-2]MCR6515360.1 sporulation integral membrane protein YlbJ [Clostridium sp. LY3-2]